jgi:hypothetical protein
MTIYYHSKCTTSFFIADGLGFRNVLRTDDTDLKFVFKKLKYSNPNGVTPMDFEGWIAEHTGFLLMSRKTNIDPRAKLQYHCEL